MSIIGRRLMKSISSSRLFHLSTRLNIDPKLVEEVRIPVPWGHIAGRWWGSKDIQPIIAIHGWQDNAGSWEPFAKLMPEKYSILAIDVPGNGLSSHLPPFQTYSFFCSATLLRRIKKFYDFDRLSLLGHSGGSAMCFVYSTIFPEDVHSYCGLDYLLYAYKNEEKRAESFGKLLDKTIVLALRDPNKAKTYTIDEAVKTWSAASRGSLTDESVRILMKRGTVRLANGKVAFGRDNRLKAPDLSSINVAQAYFIAENAKCNICLVKGAKSKYFDQGIKNCPEVLNILERNAKSFYFYKVDGNHHFHMDIPDQVVKLYISFMDDISK